MTIIAPEWVEDPHAATRFLMQAEGEELPVGGRFICSEEAKEEAVWALLESKGLSLRGFGQCEVVATRIVRAGHSAFAEEIAEMRQISFESGYRLQSVEVGDVDSGEAVVLASEAGYVPWWQQVAGN